MMPEQARSRDRCPPSPPPGLLLLVGSGGVVRNPLFECVRLCVSRSVSPSPSPWLSRLWPSVSPTNVDERGRMWTDGDADGD
uniref:Uncharacterized protein n=1 Tax=Physcomitrium patens TaxID=3218 RepID=A0A2K1JHF3_PHYPA|nr:hypothetical protein PHYPA_018390 [Physcomitrium patens]